MIKKFILISLLLFSTLSQGGKLDDISDRLDEIEDQILLNQALINREWAIRHQTKPSMITNNDLLLQTINNDKYYLQANTIKTIKPNIQFIVILTESNGLKIDPVTKKEFLGSGIFFLINCANNTASMNAVYMYDKNLNKVRQIDTSFPFAPIKDTSFLYGAKHMVCS